MLKRATPRFFRQPNLHRRLTLALVAQTVLVLLMAALALFLVLGRFLRAGEEQRLERLVEQVSIHEDSRDQQALEFDRGFPDDVHVRLLRGDVVVAATPGFPAVPLDAPPGHSLAAQHQVLTREVREDGVRYTLQLVGDPVGVRLALQAYLRALAIIVPAAALVVALISSRVAANMLSPVRRLERAAAGVSGSRALRTPLPGATATDELGRLANTLQATFARLADGMDREVAFLRAAAHDLRSPLTALKTRMEAVLAKERQPDAYRAALRELQRDVDRMAQLVDHLLMLANESAPGDLPEVDLVAIASTAVDAARAARPNTTLTTSFAPDTPRVGGDAILLNQLLRNLIDNAALHAAGASAQVSTARAADGGAILQVKDEGPGLDEAHVKRLGEPFYRPDPARTRGDATDPGTSNLSGSGLGLAIVKRVVEWHNAQWQLSSRPAEGFSVTISFPPLPAGTPARRPAA